MLSDISITDISMSRELVQSGHGCIGHTGTVYSMTIEAKAEVDGVVATFRKAVEVPREVVDAVRDLMGMCNRCKNEDR